MSRKRKIVDHEAIVLTEECSICVQNKLPTKLKDLESFTLSCTIGHLNFTNTSCDLDASVSLMPLSIARKLDLREMKDTNVVTPHFTLRRTKGYPLNACPALVSIQAIFVQA